MLTKKKVLLAKPETVYGTDSAPVALNGIQTSNFKLTPYDSETVSREFDKPSFGNNPEITVAKRVMLEFDVELAGSGTAGTAPGFGVLLRGCAFAETINASPPSVDYTPVSQAFESLTFYHWQDNAFHKITGARGSVSFSLSAKKIPTLKFKFTGLYNAPVKQAPSAVDWTKFKTPAVVSTAQTTGFSILGYSGNLLELEIDMANEVKHRVVVGQEEVIIADRKPSGSITLDAPQLDVKNFFTEVDGNTLGAFNIQHGQTPGNICVITAPAAQPKKPDYGDDEGTLTLKLELSLNPTSAGNDELKLTFK